MPLGADERAGVDALIDQYRIADALEAKGLQMDLGCKVIAKLLARYKLFDLVQDVPGDVVECGVYRGASLFFWASLIEIFSPQSERKVYGLDTFCGFGSEIEKDFDQRNVEALSASEHFKPRSKETLYEIAEGLGLRHRIELIEGDVRQTCVSLVSSNPGLRIAFMHLDLDVYDGTLAALNALYPRVSAGGVVLFDQYGNKDWGETDAADSFFRGGSSRLKRLPWSSGSMAYHQR